MSSVYPLPTYRLKERIYENADKSIVIYRTRKKQTIKYIAVKIYSKSRQPFYDHEYSFLKNINHPSIINVTGAAEDKNYFYMEMEYCPSGDLSHCLWPNKGANYFEKIIKTVSVQLLLGLKTLHQNGIIHCNLKPSNIIIDEFGNVKICDFKKALNTNTMTMQEIKKNKTAMTPCYTAPELFNENGVYTFKTDLWALGCIMYEMAIGQVPFFEERVNKLIMKILKEEINFNKKQFNQYSMEFMDVLRKLLEKDPDKRPSWGEIENYPFWGLNYNNNPAPSARRRQNSNLDNSYFSLNNSDINNNSALNENSLRQIKKHESSSSSTNLHMNLNKNSEVKNFDINYEGEYDNNGDKNDKEVNINIDNNNANNFQNDEENSNYTNAKFKHLLNKNNSNDLSMSLLKINKLGDKKEKNEVTDILNDMAISLAKPDELPKIINIMMHASDKNIKPIIGNKIIEPNQKPITYDEKMIPFKPIYKIDKMKELIIYSENSTEVEKYLKQMYIVFLDFEEKKKYDELLNLLNYFETIILSKEISNSIINTLFIQKFIEFLDINNDQIRIRSCSIIASLIRYATTMEKSLDEYNLPESLISFISDNNILLNRIAISTLGEYLFFVSTQVEAELDQIKLGQKSNWSISQESITALLFALNHIDEKVKFYSLKTIENICSLTTIAKQYFASNDDFINKIIEIINSECENPEIRTSAFNTVSHIIRHEPSLIKCFIDKMDSLNFVIEKESQRNQQYIINCLLFGIAQDNKLANYINIDELIPVLINLLKNSNNVIKPKVILLLSLTFNQVELISKYGEKIFELMMKLRKEKHQFYYYVKLFESFMINYCININKRYINICETQTSNNNPEIISILKCFNIIAPYHKISYIIYNKEFLLCTFNLILNSDLKSEQIFYAFESYKAFSENPFSVEENSDLIINKIFTKLLSLTNKLNDEYRRFPLNICANILTVLLEDDKLYSSTTIEGGKTNQINSLIITILPDIYSLLKNEDTVIDSLAFLSLIIERNSAFIKFYRNVGIIDYIFILMKDPNLYSNLNLIKILIKLIESSDTGFKDILDLDLIDKVNYMISKDNLEEITVYTEYVIEMLFDLLFKINETKRKFSSNYDKENFKKNFTDKIEKIAVNFKLCIKLLGCEHENIQELSCVNLIFMLQFFPNGFNKYINGNVKFTIEDIPDLLKGLDSSCKKIHKKMIKIFKWIIEYQDDAKEILKNYISYIQICVEKIKNSATEQDTMETARKFLENDLVKITNS
jgi:serine/threonine-protein kinase ULK4